MKRTFLLTLFAFLVARSFAVFPQIAVKPLCLDQLQSPTNITHAGDGSGRLFICEQRGKIVIFKNGMLQPTPFLDIGAKLVPPPGAYDERGLLGMAFHPDYENSGTPGHRRFYLFYSVTSPNALANSMIAGISTGDPCTVTTTAPHALETGDLVVINGVTGGTFTPSINGTFTVTFVSPTQFTVPVNCSDTTGLSVTAGRVRPQNPVNGGTVIAEFLVNANDPNVADPASERILLSFDRPQSNHNGGQLEFGPEVGPGGERYLYFGVGDGGSQRDNDVGHTGGSTARPAGNLGNGQDKTKLLGKIHRIDPLGTNGPGGQYGIPGDNPFAGAGGGVRQEIYAYGLRNPWRISFDVLTGRMFCGDVGQDSIEEIDIIVKGGNYGWHAKEGTRVEDAVLLNALQNGGSVLVDPPPSATATLPGGEVLIDPIGQYAHPSVTFGMPPLDKVGNSVTGGYVYRGSAFPALVGKYIFADWGLINPIPTGTMLGLEETSPNVWEYSRLDVVGGNPIPTHVAAFGVDEDGEIYIATKTNTSVTANDPNTGLPAGGLYKIVPPSLGSVTVEPSRDNTIFEEVTNNSNGRGDLAAGLSTTGLAKRRALLAFDLAHVVPRGAFLNSAELTLTVLSGTAGTPAFSLHPLLEDWGEGESLGAENAPAETGDATWTSAFFDSTTPTPWSTPGGEFLATVSASASVSQIGSVTWTGSGLLADVNNWLADPGLNFGWLLRDDTETSGMGTERQFASLENANLASRPHLTLGYAGPAVTRREQWLQQYHAVGQFVDDLGDGDTDGLVAQIEYALGTSPLDPDAPAALVVINSTPSGSDRIITITFRRDPRATDLTYELQTSDDLAAWTTLVESAGGASPSGTGFVSDNDIPGEFPFKLVTGQRTVPASSQPAFRLRALRYESAGVLAQTAALTFTPSTTDSPTLTTPAAGAVVKHPINVSFTLPRAALADSVRLIFDNGTLAHELTLAASNESAGAHSFSFNPANPTASAAIASGGAIPDGTYTVSISYQDAAGNPRAADSHANVKIDTVAPTFTTPVGGYTPLIVSAGQLPNYISQALPSMDTVLTEQSPAPQSTTVPGIVPVTLTATDAAGNQGTTTFNVTVRPTAAVNLKFIASGEGAPDADTPGVPGGPPTGATLVSFSVPCIDDTGDVSYLAKWTSSEGRSSGLFHNDTCLLGIGGDAEPVAGAKIKTLSDPVGSAGNVALLATLSGVPKANSAAVLSNAAGGRVPQVIAQAGSAATADGAKFKSFKGVAVEGDYTAFLAQLVAGTGTALRTNATNDVGLWVKDGAAPLVLALREGQMIGGKTIKTIVSFAAGSGSPGQGRGWLRELPAGGARLLALVIFKEAKSQAIVQVDTTNVANPAVLSETAVANATGSPSINDATFASYGLPAAGAQGRSAFLGALTVNPALTISRADARAIFTNDAGRYVPLARVGRDAGVNSAKFSVLKDPIVTHDGGVAFPATLKGGTAKGLAATTLWWQPPGEALSLLAQGGAEPGDLPSAQWKSFTSLAAAANRGPIFTATLVPGKGGVTKASANGVWAMDFDGDLRLLFRGGVTQIDLGGVTGLKTVKKFTLLKALPGSVGVTRSFNDAQQVVWLAEFADKSQAIVTTEVP